MEVKLILVLRSDDILSCNRRDKKDVKILPRTHCSAWIGIALSNSIFAFHNFFICLFAPAILLDITYSPAGCIFMYPL